MRRELKLRVDSLPGIEKRIIGAGGVTLAQAIYRYTYFNQPEGSVLKITQKPEGTFRTVIKARNGTFDIVSSDPVDNEEELMAELTSRFGIKKRLVNHRTFFTFERSDLSLNDIEGLGIFLIIENENPTLEIVAKLGIVNPEIITRSFDDL